LGFKFGYTDTNCVSSPNVYIFSDHFGCEGLCFLVEIEI
jgi:hypothetical protein